MNTATKFVTWSAASAAILLSVVRAEDNIVHVVPTRKLAHLDMRFRQLMLDEYAIDRHRGVKKVYPQAAKLNRPVVECEGPHELESMSLNMPSVIYDRAAGKYRMWWYNIWHLPRDQGYLYGALCYAESTDGLKWVKPALNQLDYKGHGKANNCIAGVGLSQWGTSVAHGHDGQFRCFFTPSDSTAVLKDGIHAGENKRISWNPITNIIEGRQKVGPLINDLTHVMYDPVLERYLASVRTWSPLAGSKEQAKWRRAAALYTSNDGIKWKNTGRLLQTDLKFDEYVENLGHRQRRDLPAWGELHDLPMQRYEGLIIGLNGILFFYDVDVAKQKEIAGMETAYFLGWSRDGVNWSRPYERRPLIDMPWGTEDWGRHTIGSPFMIVHEREIWIYHDVGRGHTNRTYKTPRPKQISFSKLRRDGFAGYRPVDGHGWIQTAPFKASGRLQVNADATDGEVRVEVLEVVEQSQHVGKRDWKPLEEFSAKHCLPLTGDLYGQPINWTNAKWSDLDGKLVALRFYLDQATIYSFWTRTKPDSGAVVNLVP